MKLNTKDYEERMKKSLGSLEETLSTVRAGRANAGVLSRVTFDYWGTPTPITTMADVRVTDAKTLTISPFDAKSIKDMEKAILASDIGITPQNDGKVLRLIFPQPTEERRRELKKQIQKYGEDAKVAIRNIRRDANDACKAQKKDGTMTEDEQKASEKAVQDLTDKYIKQVDAITAAKDKEIMEI
ncbi:MAG: ribosome recycling factor [Clostridia bacterium]|nr:ribosome recycling factor [Clostridia bacterium]